MKNRKEIDNATLALFYDNKRKIPYNKREIAVSLIYLMNDIYNLDLEEYRMTPFNDLYDAIIHILEGFTEREILVINQYYNFDGKGFRTLKQIGDEVGVTGNQIAQNRNKALVKFRVKFRQKNLKSLIETVKEKMDRYENEIMCLQDGIDQRMSALTELSDYVCIEHDGSIIDYNYLIEDMDFSVRTYNCLNRAGIANLSDLAGMKYEDFMKVRNLGRKGIDEITEKLKEYGVIVERA